MLLVAKKRPKPKTNRQVTKIQRLNTKANKSTTKKAKSKVQTITNTRNQERPETCQEDGTGRLWNPRAQQNRTDPLTEGKTWT